MKPNKILKFLVTGTLVFSTVISSSIVDDVPSFCITSYAASEKLDAPQNFSYESNNTSIKLKWDTVKNADAYRVYMFDSKAMEYKEYNNYTSTNCTIKDLDQNTIYRFKVAALIKTKGKYVVQTKSPVLKAKTTNVSFPNPPSNNYTGVVEDGNSKYYFKNGEGQCNYWVTLKNGSYYYAASNGKLTKYSFKSEKSPTSNKVSNYIYVNDKRVGEKGLKHGDDSFFYYAFGDKYYNCYANSYTNGIEIETIPPTLPIQACYDITSGKYLGEFYGNPVLDSSGCVIKGSLFNSKDGYLYDFSGKNKAPKKTKAPAIVIADQITKLNYVGGVDYSVIYCNNSSKKIKYLTLTVVVANKVNDVVSDSITGNMVFSLQDTGPVNAHDHQYTGWDAFMYNTTADTVYIYSVTVEYMDGTTLELDYNTLAIV